jgi:ATP-dependent Clp protease ATP-binding subunit ClpB
MVDEACAVIRTEIDSMPQELDEITRRVMQLEIEEAAVKKEKDKASKERLEALRRELADLRAQADAMHAQWEAERQVDRLVGQGPIGDVAVREHRRGDQRGVLDADQERACAAEPRRIPDHKDPRTSRFQKRVERQALAPEHA